MAWNIGDYSEFVSQARETFGLDREEANYLYHELRSDLDRAVTADDLIEYGDLAADIIEPLLEGEEPEDEYPEEAYDYYEESGDDRPFEEWFEEEWLYPDDEVEITIDLRYKG